MLLLATSGIFTVSEIVSPPWLVSEINKNAPVQHAPPNVGCLPRLRLWLPRTGTINEFAPKFVRIISLLVFSSCRRIQIGV